MKKIYCIICGKNRKFEKRIISYLLEKTLVLSIVWSKCKNEDEKKIFFSWRSKAKWIYKWIAQKGLYNSKLYWTPSYFLTFTITGCISIFAFASFRGISIGTTSSAIWLKIRAITSGIKEYESIIKKKKKKHDKIVLLAKSKLNSIEVLISKALINSIISHDLFVLINTALNKYSEMKEEIKSL